MNKTNILRFARVYAYFFSTLLVVFFSLLQVAQGGDQDVNEKRSCIQSVDGYSYISEEKTVSELRSAALNNAKQQALTNAKTYIRSKTEVESFVLKSDEVLINAEGTVTILEQKNYGIQDNSRYHIWVKAEVEYMLGDGGSIVGKPSAGASSAPVSSAADKTQKITLPSAVGPLTVKIWSPKKEYKEGEKIEVFVQGNHDFYAKIVDISGQGEIVQLLPNGYRTSAFFQGGRTYKIPDQEDKFNLTVSPPFGKDKIVVYASEVPLGQVAMTNIGQGLSAYAGDQKTLAVSTRGIAVTAKESGSKEPPVADFYEASYEIQTSK